MKVRVTNCDDCPFRYYDTEAGDTFCVVTKEKGYRGKMYEKEITIKDTVSSDSAIVSPDWCPLRKSSIEVVYVGKAKTKTTS